MLVNQRAYDTALARLRKQYGYQSDKLSPEVASANLSEFVQACGAEIGFVRTVEAKVRAYADNNLNRIGSGDNYTTQRVNVGSSRAEAAERTDTKSDRVMALNTLLDILQTSSAEDILAYVTTPQFEKLVGSKEYKFNFLRAHLCQPIDEFVAAMKKHKTKYPSAYVLCLLLNEQNVATMAPITLATLFWNYDAKLVAELVIHVYQKMPAVLGGFDGGSAITEAELRLVLHDDEAMIERLNKHRASMRLSQYLPANARTPGKDQLADEGLSAYELFQYNENAIFAVEHFLRETYKPLLANCMFEENKPVARALKAPHFYYLVTASVYMIFTPGAKNDQYYRYEMFRKHLRELLASYNSKQNSNVTPIIFSGIINIDGTHYLPYFIFKNSENKTQVMTVDPSPRVYPGDSDPKEKTRLKLIAIFQDIFPGAEVTDAKVVQMLRERDCGPNSATTLRDAFATTHSATPLVKIVDDRLVLDRSQLSVRAEPVRVNQYNGKFVYDEKIEVDSRNNRLWWMQQLGQLEKVYPLSMRKTRPDQSEERAMSIDDEYYAEDQVVTEFSYVRQVESQERQDAREINISVVQSLLLTDQEGQQLRNRIKAEFNRSLVPPNPAELVRFIKSKVTESVQFDTLVAAHHNNVELLAADVVTVLLRDVIPRALINVFREHVAGLPNATTLREEAIINNYLATNNHLYNALTLYQQRLLKQQMQVIAAEVIPAKLVAAHAEVITGLFARYGFDYVSQLPASPSGSFTTASVAEVMLTVKDVVVTSASVRESTDYLMLHDNDSFAGIASEGLKAALGTVMSDVTVQLKAVLAAQFFDVHALLAAFNTDGAFVPWDEAQLKTSIRFNALSGGLLSLRVLTEVNRMVCDHVNAALTTHVEVNAGRFVGTVFYTKHLASSDNATLHLWYKSSAGEALATEALSNFVDVIRDETDAIKPLFQQRVTQAKLINKVIEKLWSAINDELVKRYTIAAQHLLSANQHRLTAEASADLFAGVELNDIACAWVAEYQKTAPTEFNQFASTDSLRLYFTRWFTDSWLYRLQYFSNQVLSYNTSLTKLANLVGQLQRSIGSEKLGALAAEFAKFNEQLSAMRMANTSILALLDDSSQVTKREAQVVKFLFDFVQVLYRHYIPNNLSPSAMTVHLRAFFYAIFNILSQKVLSVDTVSIHDAVLSALLKDSVYKAGFAGFHALPNEMTLTVLPEEKDVPNTLRKPLTKEVILRCLGYWYTNESLKDKWFAGEKLDLVTFLTRMANEIVIPDTFELEKATVDTISRYLKQFNDGVGMGVYESTNTLDRICAALLRTSTLCQYKPTAIRFKDIKEFLNLNEADVKAKSSVVPPTVATALNVQGSGQEPVEIPDATVQPLVMKRIRDLRAKDPKAKLVVKDIREEVIAELRAQQKTVLPVASDSSSSSSSTIFAATSASMNAAITTYNPSTLVVSARNISNVQPSDVKRGYFSSSWFFGGGLTPLEKTLLLIQQKHSQQSDFNLDTDDVEQLHVLIKKQWLKMIDGKSAEQVLALREKFLCEPSRSEKVYIAIAELLAMNSRANGKQVAAVEILFTESLNLLNYQLPQRIVTDLGLTDEDTSIDLITLSKLVILPSQYAISIEWIIDAYTKKSELLHPYTGQSLSDVELNAIMLHREAYRLLEQVDANCLSAITPQLISHLRTYLNEAIFASGFGSNYNSSENNRAFNAKRKFDTTLTALTEGERKALLNEKIPGSEADTVRSVFAESEPKKVIREGKISWEQGSCLTYGGVRLAKVVLAYEPKNHGLTNNELVTRARAAGLNNVIQQRAYATGTQQYSIKIPGELSIVTFASGAQYKGPKLR